jgi:hypothetical protein
MNWPRSSFRRARRFPPEWTSAMRPRIAWSRINRQTAERLEKAGRMRRRGRTPLPAERGMRACRPQAEFRITYCNIIHAFCQVKSADAFQHIRLPLREKVAAKQPDEGSRRPFRALSDGSVDGWKEERKFNAKDAKEDAKSAKAGVARRERRYMRVRFARSAIIHKPPTSQRHEPLCVLCAFLCVLCVDPFFSSPPPQRPPPAPTARRCDA